jgi:phenylacetate-CoA ligase
MFLREALYVPITLARQYARPDGIERRKLRWINEMLAHARERVPYYRDDPRYAHAPLARLDDLTDLPVLRKQTLRDRPQADFLAEGTDPHKWRQFQTSGSTGRRVVVRHDERTHDYHIAACFRRFLATGRYLPTYRLSHIRPYESPSRPFEKLKLFRRHTILSRKPMDEIKAELLANRPQVLIGWPVHLRELLRSMTDAELARLSETLRLVFTESELLTPEYRVQLTERFRVPVFDEYSAFEVLNVYYECARGGRHIAEDRVHVEVVDDGGVPLPPGHEGRLLITAYMERAMPLFRFAIGDVGRINRDPCLCGRTFRTLELTRGRADDVVVLADGRRIYSDTFMWISAWHSGVAECFVHQDGAGRVRMSVVLADPREPAEPILDAVRTRLFDVAGGPFEIDLVTAAQLPVTAGGKGRFVASEYPVGI